MSSLKSIVDHYLKNNNDRINDEFEDDIIEFEDELANQDKFNRSILNIENNKQDLIGDDNGINGLLNLYYNKENNFFFLFYLLFRFEIFYLIIIICLLFLFILNLKNKIFLGDSGIYILGAFISFVIISEYNKQSTKFFADDIFIIMMIPGLDFIRLFFERISKGKNPFLGDKNHLHHLLIDKFGFFKSYLLIVILYVSPFLFKLTNVSNFYIITLYVIFYNILFIYLRKSFVRKKNN